MKKDRPICHVFGYGSLMYPSGINGRGMSHKYVWKDLSWATLYGFRRGMYACYMKLLYYGVLNDARSKVEGVIVPMFSKRDFDILMDNEGASDRYEHKMYEITNVTDSIIQNGAAFKSNGSSIYVLENKEDKSAQGRTAHWYVANVWDGLQHWGPSIVELARNTGIMEPTKAQMRSRYLYNAIKRMRRLYHTCG